MYDPFQLKLVKFMHCTPGMSNKSVEIANK